MTLKRNLESFGKKLALAGSLSLGLTGALVASDTRTAEACGCFVPPDPSVPLVQAGERIVFAVDNSVVTATIQIQYAGADAKAFGWILPLPSLPTMDLGSDEFFSQVTNVTQPKYELTRVYGDHCNNGTRGGGFGVATPQAAGEDANGGTTNAPYNPLVIQDSLGPYDYAILKADDKTAMLDWLTTNRYFVPTGTDAAVDPYIHVGSFFLALKLQSGKSTGDLQPVVVKYASDLPMIPIVLTSVAAQPDMGIQVFMLGSGRAIPRNYYHTVLNDAVIDWNTAGQNYNDVIIRATKEAPGRHTFVTEYAGSTSVMQNVLDPPNRFGSASDMMQIHDPVAFVDYLRANNFSFSGALLAILETALPFPAQLQTQQGVTLAQYYQNFDYWYGTYRQQNPGIFDGLTFADPSTLVDDIEKRVVVPTLAAGKLFTDHTYLTRLYTTLSPEQMNSDPVFSYNPDLPDVSNVHNATLTIGCNLFGNTTSATLQTADGFTMNYPGGNPPTSLPTMPASLRIETLRESGQPQVVTDNQGTISTALGNSGGCSVAPGATSNSGGGMFSLFGLGALALLLRRIYSGEGLPALPRRAKLIEPPARRALLTRIDS